MTIAERILECLREAAASDRELAARGRSDWDGWADLPRVRRWLAAAGPPPPGDDTLRRALARLVRDGDVESRDDGWRATATEG